MYLYEIPKAYLEVLENCDPETGEINEEALEAINDTLHNKADAYAKVIQSLACSNQAVELEIDRLMKITESNEKKIQTLKDNLMNAMLDMDDQKFKTDLFSFSVRTSGAQAVDIDESQDIPSEYLKTTVTVDKTKVKDALKKGEKLGFAKLKDRKQYLMIK